MKSLIDHRYSVSRLVFFFVFTLFVSAVASAQPANDLCSNAATLTPGVGTCTTVAGYLKAPSGATPNATATAGINAFCGNTTSPDVWYTFTALSTFPTISLSGMGTSMDDNPRLQIFNTNSCTAGTLNASLNTCASVSNSALLTVTPTNALVVGTSYLVRVYTTTTITAAQTSAVWSFNICVSDPPPNDLCGAASPLISGTTLSTTNGTAYGATYTAGGGVPGVNGCLTTSPDVWYSFVAKTANPTIVTTLVSGSGSRRTELYSGSCGALVSLPCSGNSNNLVASGLTPGLTYYIRVFSSNVSGFTFTIGITDPAPANNLCGSPVVLSSAVTPACTAATGNLYGSTITATTISGYDCSGGLAVFDVWYKFVAGTTNPTISLNNVGTSLTGAVGMQLLSNNCGGTFTSFYCGSTSIAANYLTPGTTYLIRVYGTGAIPTTNVGYGFDICVQDPVVAGPPANDECAGAVNLSVNNACNSIISDMGGSTASSTPLSGSCTGPLAYDVWFKFKAVNNTATITLGSLGASFLNPGIEVFTGTCGSLTAVACGASPLTMSGSLTTGTTYYVRVYSQTAPPPNGAARFNICVTSSLLPAVRFGNSYVNISKKRTGGVVEPGDTLEIRMTINHVSPAGMVTMYGLRYVDNIPTNTKMVTGAGNFLGVITNEGLPYHQYTLTAGDDPATYLAAPPGGEYNIRMNLGFGTSTPGIPVINNAAETATATGTMTDHFTSSDPSNNKPFGGGGVLFATAFRVVVDNKIGDTVKLNPGQFIYQTTLGGPDITLTSTPYEILISTPLNLCSNSIGINNAAELGGTFGSGSTLNRATDLTTPIAGYSFVNNVSPSIALGDGRYAIVKNISPRTSTNKLAGRAGACPVVPFDDALSCGNRMHNGHWYIDGDHTGTTTAAGNNPPGIGTTGGYMLEVNADYVASEVFSQTLTNLCPNTYYEFSAWFRNICPTCGVDSLGQQFTGTATAPALGYPGVYPNLSFALNGLDYYSTGEIDTLGWLKKGFVFRTGPVQTSADFTIRNNAQGGGGNDWVMDDIAVATCLPTMSYSPTINPTVCENNPITINDTISSFFRNYTTYKWQRSTNSGSTWVDITGVTTLPDTNHYITSYSISTANTTLSNNNDRYRVVVATTAANLTNGNCNISDGVTISLSVLNCGIALKTDLLSFNGSLTNKIAVLSWTTSRENEPVRFDLQSSDDNISFTTITSMNGNNNGKEINYYAFTDPKLVSTKRWYRLIVISDNGNKKYSHIIQLSNNQVDFDVDDVVNPFSEQILFNVTTSRSSKVDVELIDLQGRNVKSNSYLIYAGTNSLRLLNTASLAAGIYTLRIKNNNQIISKKMVKNN